MAVRIVHLAAGAGSMYCGACARDVHMLRGMIARGHDVQVIPLYTPLRVEGDQPLPTDAVYLGGLNAWLQQHSAFFRALPARLDRALDHPGLLRAISRFAISTDAASLGPMTVSVLAGRDGRQRKEFARLLQHLQSQPAPDVFILTNLLLAGFAPEIKRAYDLPVICQLQGEDGFINATREPSRSQAWELMRQAAGSVDAFVAPGQDYAARMSEALGLPPGKARVIRTGLDLAAFRRPTRPEPGAFTVGYLSSILPTKGLDLLVGALRLLVAEGREVRLRIAGAVLSPRYWRDVQRKIAQAGLTDRVAILGELDLPDKLAFLHSCSVFCQPSRGYEVRGLTVLEALAAGTPVVAPDTGVFPEMLALTGGGLFFSAGDAASLAQTLARLQDEPALAATLLEPTPAALDAHHGPAATVEEWERLLGELTTPAS
jgi:glycosyltransferase involved in cell wall biosynthesis